MDDIGPAGGFEFDLDEVGGVEGLKGMAPSWKVLSRLGKLYSVLASGKRIEIMFFLNFTSLTPSILCKLTGMAPNLLSFHLRKLEKAGVISGERDGKFIVYSMTDLGRSVTGPLVK